MHVRWRGLELPAKVTLDGQSRSQTFGRFTAEPFERGFGITVGNSLRRILLSSLEGAAISKVSIKSQGKMVTHEFSTIPGVFEDVTDILLNIKGLIDLKVPWYQNYAIKDDLVTPPCATAGNKFLEGWDRLESVAFFGGHVAILTSPHGKKAPVTGSFTDANGKASRGPVKFQIDIS